jgi:CheY-like chemotaxis protein
MSGRRILIVDDNAINLKLAASVMEHAGYEVLQASDAEAALAVIARTPPELILMDVAMPGMDGLTLTRKLKSDPATSHIRIIALTASAMRGDRQRSKEAGCDGYITKPIDTRRLPEQVAAVLESGLPPWPDKEAP